MKIRYIDLFCGIGGFRIAAAQSFSKFDIASECVFSSDIDPYCQKSYYANFGEFPYGNIKDINVNSIPDHELLFGGFPCQPFSIIGNGEGFNDVRGTLFFDIARIIEAKRPRAFILENVKRLATHENGKTLKKIIGTLKGIGYSVDYKVLNALDYGLPQKRERIFIVGFHNEISFPWPEKMKNRIPLEKILEKKVDSKYYASEYIQNKRKEKHKSLVNPSVWHENKSGNISSYAYSCALRSGASHNYLLVNGERHFTPREMLRLQGFPDTYKIVVPDAQVKKQAGNAAPVNVVMSVIEAFIPILMADSIKPMHKNYLESYVNREEKPRLRTVEKVKPPYPLNEFPKEQLGIR